MTCCIHAVSSLIVVGCLSTRNLIENWYIDPWASPEPMENLAMHVALKWENTSSDVIEWNLWYAIEHQRRSWAASGSMQLHVYQHFFEFIISCTLESKSKHMYRSWIMSFVAHFLLKKLGMQVGSIVYQSNHVAYFNLSHIFLTSVYIQLYNSYTQCHRDHMQGWFTCDYCTVTSFICLKLPQRCIHNNGQIAKLKLPPNFPKVWKLPA